MTDADLAATIDAAWESRETLGPATRGPWREAVEEALDELDDGRVRVAGPSVSRASHAASIVAARSASVIAYPKRLEASKGVRTMLDPPPKCQRGSPRTREGIRRRLQGQIKATINNCIESPLLCNL